MRIYGSVQLCFWESFEIQKLSDQAKLLAIYLLTGPHSNMLGCVRLPDGYIIEDLKWEIQTAENSFEQLSKIDFLTRDNHSAWVVIHQFIKWNPIQNPRQGIGIKKLFDAVPEKSMVFKPLVKGLLTYGKYLEKEFFDRLHTLQNIQESVIEECAADKEQDQDQDQKKIIMSGKPDGMFNDLNYKSQAIEILNFLNEKTGKAFRLNDANLKKVISKLKTGATVMECRQIIAMKYREWNKNPDMRKYIRPETLFGGKFESYIGELVLPKEEEGSNEQY